jgi:hypothetical protein
MSGLSFAFPGFTVRLDAAAPSPTAGGQEQGQAHKRQQQPPRDGGGLAPLLAELSELSGGEEETACEEGRAEGGEEGGEEAGGEAGAEAEARGRGPDGRQEEPGAGGRGQAALHRAGAGTLTGLPGEVLELVLVHLCTSHPHGPGQAGDADGPAVRTLISLSCTCTALRASVVATGGGPLMALAWEGCGRGSLAAGAAAAVCAAEGLALRGPGNWPVACAVLRARRRAGERCRGLRPRPGAGYRARAVQRAQATSRAVTGCAPSLLPPLNPTPSICVCVKPRTSANPRIEHIAADGDRKGQGGAECRRSAERSAGRSADGLFFNTTHRCFSTPPTR